MSPLLVLHISAGAFALAVAAVALVTRKGGRLHVRAGLVFVPAMIAMGLAGALLATLRPTAVSIVAGLLSAYLVATAMTRSWWAGDVPRWFSFGAPALAIAIGTAGLWWGIAARNAADGLKDGHPAGRYFVFGAIALVGAAGDLRWFGIGARRDTTIRHTATQRQWRHVWRMAVATLMAAVSFFLGQPQVFPPALQSGARRAVPVVAMLAVFLYWLTRLGGRRIAEWHRARQA